MKNYAINRNKIIQKKYYFFVNINPHINIKGLY